MKKILSYQHAKPCENICIMREIFVAVKRDSHAKVKIDLYKAGFPLDGTILTERLLF